MSLYGTRARQCASAKNSGPSKPSSYNSGSSSQKHAAADTDAKYQGPPSQSSIPVMSKPNMHMFDRYGHHDSTLPAKPQQDVERRANTLPLPVPIQCRANARLYLRSATK
ncbi:hypothetical protein DFH29DRAFT_876023 [Suillus ampliporus]|nr:hypothetical protein DFH29DRAFT_876023 [Suillus ampliporus]